MRVGSCTALAVMRMLDATGIAMEGKEAVIVGHSELVGKPVSLMLLDRLATVTICHIATARRGLLAEHVRRAEILVVAVGSPEVIKGEWIHPGAVVIDVGINQVEKRIVGDVEFAAAQERAAFITPVPGGVGPVTVSRLRLQECSLRFTLYLRWLFFELNGELHRFPSPHDREGHRVSRLIVAHFLAELLSVVDLMVTNGHDQVAGGSAACIHIVCNRQGNSKRSDR